MATKKSPDEILADAIADAKQVLKTTETEVAVQSPKVKVTVKSALAAQDTTTNQRVVREVPGKFAIKITEFVRK